ncbi:COG1470 family protein [Pyrobaculum aerophilum]|uniref:Uncharacterized protein n=1 Tax=Pyrobaculum aerophilum TaxID=13773 RepID=A0A371QVS5_9CREN|nr:hypothetical protein [Pyrobaculum aerophilum]RFA94269.1 hypothetical protein CGL51_10635 [Pyrobaculum aerophilum]RFA98606.1 hypothetical protein CGL52_06745 [Pyrobaculum aerophilum]
MTPNKKAKAMSPVSYAVLLGIVAAIIAGAVMIIVIGNPANTITITTREVVTSTETVTVTTRPPPETTTITVTQTSIQPMPINQTDGRRCFVFVNIVGTNATISGGVVYASGPFYIDVEVVRTAGGCDAALDALTAGSVIKVSPTTPHVVPGTAGTHGPYRFEFTASGYGGISFRLTTIAHVGGACVETCMLVGRNLTVEPPLKKCEPSLRFVGTNATAISPGVYQVYPGMAYYIDVEIGGYVPNPPYASYFVQLTPLPTTYVTVLPPNPRTVSTPIPPSQSTRFEFAVSPSAPTGHEFAALIEGWAATATGLRECIAKLEGPRFRVANRTCDIVIKLVKTNATQSGGEFIMEEGKSYLYVYYIYIPNAYGTLEVKGERAVIYEVKALDYRLITPPSGASVFVGTDYFLFDPLPPGGFEAEVSFLVTAISSGTGNLVVRALMYDQARQYLPCNKSLSLPIVIKPPPIKACEIRINAPPNIHIWTNGGPGSLLVTYDVGIDTTPDGLNTVLTITPQTPITLVSPSSPYTAVSDFLVGVVLRMPQSTSPGIYNVIYSATASGQGTQCTSRAVTLINVTRCHWKIEVLNKTPLMLEAGRSYIVRVAVSGAPYPARLTASSSNPSAAQITPNWPGAPVITGDGIYEFRVDALASGNVMFIFAVRSEAPFEYCNARVAVNATVKPREEAICKPEFSIKTNMTDLGGGRYQILPGGRYEVLIRVGGSLPSGNYRLGLAFGSPLNGYITWVNPTTGYRDFSAPPLPVDLSYVFQVSPGAPQGSSSPLRLVLSPLGASNCRLNQSLVVEVGKPPCQPRMAVRTNATEIGGRYYMEPGKVYEFVVSLYVPWAYTNMRLSMSANSGTVTTGPYSTTPTVSVSTGSSGSAAYFDISPPSPARPLSGQFTFYITPTGSTSSVEIKYESEFTPNGPQCVSAIRRNVTAMMCKPEIKLDTNATIVDVVGNTYSIVVDPGAPYALRLYIGGVITYPVAVWMWFPPTGITITPLSAMIPTPVPPVRTLDFVMQASGPGTYLSTGRLLVGDRPGLAPNKTCYELLLKIQASQWDFAIKREPGGNLTAKPGASVEAKLYIVTVSGTPRRVYLSVESAPAGWSVSISPTSGIPDFSAGVVISIPTSAVPGIYSVVIKATSGSVTKYHTINIIVS